MLPRVRASDPRVRRIFFVRVIRTVAAALAVLVAAFGFWQGAAGTSRLASPVAASSWRPEHAVVRGAFHVHTRRSDGAGSVADVAAAGAQAGLDFVVVTDHGDGMRAPDPPAYHHGVLAIDAVEISTTGGHYVALGLPAAPYPLGGDPRGLVEDVARLGGFGVVAHPASPKRSQAWTDWSLPVDAVEWINADSEWRDEHGFRLMTAAASYFWRGSESIVALFDRPANVLSRFDRLAMRRRVLAFAGHDAHGRVAFGRHGQAIRDWAGAPLPSYESVFGTFSLHVELDEAPSGEPRADAQRILGAIRAGRFFTAVDALASPVHFDLHGEGAGRRISMGGALWEEGEEPADRETASARIRARVAGPAGATLVLLRNGQEIASSSSGEIERVVPFEDAVHRVEVRIPGAPGSPPTPWIVSNPIWTRTPRPDARPERPREVIARGADDAATWHVESDGESRVRFDVAPKAGGPAIAFHYGLAAGARRGQWAALLGDTGDVRGATYVSLRVRASAPSRLWVQLRPAWPDPRRWRHSLYADEMPRDVVLPLSEWMPFPAEDGAPPTGDDVGQIAFVVDTTNTPPGTSRGFVVDEVAFVR